jgi:predicted Zn-ribbon and HTH transcriptional regulator
MEAHLTLPQALRARLTNAEPQTLKQLSTELGVREKALPDALDKLSRSLLHTDQRLHRHVPACLECGFEFSERSRSSKPSRCPRCRSERITPARFWIE